MSNVETSNLNPELRQEIISYTRSKDNTLRLRNLGLDETGNLEYHHIQEEVRAYRQYFEARFGELDPEDFPFLSTDK